jgi:hypothetical protein
MVLCNFSDVWAIPTALRAVASCGAETSGLSHTSNPPRPFLTLEML